MFHRAVLALVRRPAKTIILFLMSLVTVLLILTGVSMKHTVTQAVSALRTAFPAYIQLTHESADDPDMQTAFSELQDANETITIKQLLLHADKLDVLPGVYTSGGKMDQAKNLRTIALSQSEYYSDFLYRIFSLRHGRHIEKGDAGVLVISDALARLNGLLIGDTVSLSSVDGTPSNTQLEIIGIFECLIKSDATVTTREFEIPDNYLFTDLATVRGFAGSSNTLQTSVMFVVRDATRLERATQSILRIGGGQWTDKNISVNNNAYEKSGQPLERLNSLLQGLILVAVIIGTLMLALALLLWTRSRKWETGIFLSVGVGKTEIIMQYWLEAICVTLAASILAGVFGYFAAGMFSEAAGGMLGVNEAVSVTFQAFLVTAAMSMLIISIAVFLAAIPVLQMKPKDILSSGE